MTVHQTPAANPYDGDLLTVASIAAKGDAWWASGSLTAAAKAAGLIRVAGYLPSPRPSRNGGVCRSWIGMPEVKAA